MKKLYNSTFKKKLFFKHILSIISFVLIIVGCQQEDFNPNVVPSDLIEENLTFKEGQTILGKKLENPYSVENMQKAYDNLQLKSAISITTNHYYVRFRPKSEQELETILRDTTLTFYSYPLDVEIKRGGTHFHDPSIPEKEITWQYTVVPVNYIFPKIKYEILSNLFLLEEDNELKKLKSAKINMDYFEWLQLEEEALRITGNLPENTIKGNVLKSSSWRPAGNVTIWDDKLTYSQTTARAVFDHWEYYSCQEENWDAPIAQSSQEQILKSTTIMAPIDGDDPGVPGEPIETATCRRAIYRNEVGTTTSTHRLPLLGVEVRARRWFTTHKGYVNSIGRFVCDGTFIYDANYSIEWERYDFDIRDGSYGQAYFNGPKQSGDWNLDIVKESTPMSFLFAHIFRAAYTYYYKHDNWGIKPPPERNGVFGFLMERMHIGGRDGSGRSHYFTFNDIWSAAQIVVYSNYWDSRTIFGTTIHELAHASHWELGFTTAQYVFERKVPESWAVGVEWQITNDVYQWRYPLLNGEYQSLTINDIIETEGIFKSGGYTPLVIDLIDSHNQKEGSSLMPDDRVQGYTLSQLEYALSLSPGNWWSWRTNIKNLFDNSTEEYVDYLFQTYTD